VLIEEYSQKIEAAIASCPYIFESRVLKGKRSLYIGVIQGEIYLIDESVLLLSILSSSFYAKDYEGKGTTQEVFFGIYPSLKK